MGKLLYLFDRLREPSSHTAIAFLLGIFQVPQVTFDNWMGVATLVFGTLGVFVAETGPATKVKGF